MISISYFFTGVIATSFALFARVFSATKTMPKADDASQFTFISHDEDSKERKHRMYSHSRNAAIRNRRRAGREFLRLAKPLPVKSLTLRPPIVTANSSASTASSTTSRPSQLTDYMDSTAPCNITKNDVEVGIHQSGSLVWNQTHLTTPTQLLDNDFYLNAELYETYAENIPALDPESYAMLLHDTSLGAFEEPSTIPSSHPEQQRLISGYGIQEIWPQTALSHNADDIQDFPGYDVGADPFSSITGNRNTSLPIPHRSLFFGLDLETEYPDHDYRIMTAFEQQSAPIDQYNTDLTYAASDNVMNRSARTASQPDDREYVQEILGEQDPSKVHNSRWSLNRSNRSHTD